MDDRTYIATHVLEGLIAAGEEGLRHAGGSIRTFVPFAVELADMLLAELHPPQAQEGGDPYEREKAAAAAIEEDKPF